MEKSDIIAIFGCLVLTLVVFVGSTGFGYTIYRPLRYYDVFSLVVAWAGTLFYMWRGRQTRGAKQD